MPTLNRTKIIATVGPASSDIDTLNSLIASGCSVFRINFSHGQLSDHLHSIENIRAAADSSKVHVAILGDLQGPKIRIGAFKEGSINLQEGQQLILDSSIADDEGSVNGISYICESLPAACEPGSLLVLDDGKVELQVQQVEGVKIITHVVGGNALSSRKGLNLKGGGLAEAALTEKDYRDMEFAVNNELDYICVSFPASPADMIMARAKLDELGSRIKLIAKVERAELVESVETIDAIIEVSDGVMVARGDLAVEVGFESVTSLQKVIVSRARSLNKPVIVATQMMESMIDNRVPTRAEVSDVANAVFDYADAVMLSGETAVGRYPVAVVKTVYDVIVATEKNIITQISKHRVECEFELVDESIAMATMYLANHFKRVKAIVCLTESGGTALWMSRIKTHLPMVAMSFKDTTLNRVALYKGVKPVFLPFEKDRNGLLNDAVNRVNEVVDLASGDYVAITFGDIVGVDGNTNTLKILKVD